MPTASDVITLVKIMNAMDSEDLGTDAQQTDRYLIFINRALKELAHIAYRTRESELLNITADGYQTFTRSGQPIVDMYSPLRILGPGGSEAPLRTSYTAPKGWYRESDASPIHTKGLTGEHMLTYVGYPATVSDSNSELDFPEAGVVGLAYWVIGIAKETRNAYEESAAMYQRARERLKVIVLANEAARGKAGGYIPTINDIDRAYKF